MTKHTPGPWHVGKNGVQTWKRGIFSGPCMVAEAVGHGYPLGEGWTAESEANVRLIAAAPELLAALRACLPYLDQAVEIDKGNDIPVARHAIRARNAARAAIAKAEGRD